MLHKPGRPSMVISSSAMLGTTRLRGRPIAAGDAALLRRLHGDPLVMRTLSADGEVAPESHTRELVGRLVAHWKEHGDGVWLFHAEPDGRFIGYAGLFRRAFNGVAECELLYAVVSDAWRQGFATEMARSVLAHAFERRQEPSVVALTLEINVGSRRVIERLGFALEKTIPHAGLPHLFFRLRAATYWASQPA